MVCRVLFTAFSLGMLAGTSANAEIVRFDFTGSVTNRFNNGLPNPADIFGLTINVGNAVTGSFTIDTGASIFGTANGAVGGTGVGYTQIAPRDMRATLAGGLFTSNGDFASTILNDFQNSVNFPPADQFGLSDGVSDGVPNTTGLTILLNGNQETARMAFNFEDNQATAFNSTSLPTTLNLSVFETAQGTITGTRPSGNVNPFFYSVAFRMDTITATVVPEPASVALLWFACGGVMLNNRRRAVTA